MKDIKQDLFDRMMLLRSRYEVAFHSASDSTDWEIAKYAGVIEKGLHDGLDTAVRAVRAVVDPADMSGTAFWSTPLGALTFAAGGYSTDDMTVSQAFAAGVLGCSRQNVHDLTRKGTLPVVGRMVRVGDVRALLRDKLDKLVK